jgi:hypothetical protein
VTEIDLYISELAARLRVGQRERARILTEVRDHLDDALAHTQPDEHATVAQALDAFGSPGELAATFNAEAGTRAMRRGPVFAFSAGLVVFAGFLLAGVTQTRSTAPTNATFPTQVSFFAAVLSFQVAIVAGLRAGSRALALWRNPVAGSDDRRFVRRCSIISSCALGLAALGWTITMGYALDQLTDPNTFTLLCGGSIMLIGAALGVTATYRLRVNPADDYEAGTETVDGLFGLGERCIGLVGRHPVVSCTTIAVLSMFPAMSHAETTLRGALPWGLIQSATVVLGFVVLGPTLRLRGSDKMTHLGTNVTPMAAPPTTR